MTGMCSKFTYRFLCVASRICFRICHPVIRITGRERIPEGPAVLCANHSGMTDPIWIIAWARLCRHPRIMAKKELFRIPILKWFFTKLGAFPVDREKSDISAIKSSLQTLKDDNKLLIFPEGTRIKNGKSVHPHSGAALIAHRVNVPVVPIYLSAKRGFFRPVHLIFGEPYFLDFQGAKPDPATLDRCSVEMMQKIYSMGESS